MSSDAQAVPDEWRSKYGTFTIHSHLCERAQRELSDLRKSRLASLERTTTREPFWGVLRRRDGLGLMSKAGTTVHHVAVTTLR